jgi:hypothetical protein
MMARSALFRCFGSTALSVASTGLRNLLGPGLRRTQLRTVLAVIHPLQPKSNGYPADRICSLSRGKTLPPHRLGGVRKHDARVPVPTGDPSRRAPLASAIRDADRAITPEHHLQGD